MTRLLLALIVLGGVLVFVGVQEVRLSSAASAEPQAINCATLGNDGPRDNAHVVMSDFLLCEFAYVYEEGSGGQWNQAWVPAVPLEGKYHQRLLTLMEEGKLGAQMPVPEDIRIIVKLPDATGESDVTRVGAQDTLQGMVINDIDSLGGEEKRMLAESYPSADLDRCWILERGRKPATAGKMASLLGGGGAMMLAGVGGLIWKRRRTKPATDTADNTPAEEEDARPRGE